jgi:hypothetical protein
MILVVVRIKADINNCLRLCLDVHIDALELALALDSTKCCCLDDLDFGFGNHL